MDKRCLFSIHVCIFEKSPREERTRRVGKYVGWRRLISRRTRMGGGWGAWGGGEGGEGGGGCGGRWISVCATGQHPDNSPTPRSMIDDSLVSWVGKSILIPCKLAGNEKNQVKWISLCGLRRAFGWQYDRREDLPFDSSWLAHSFHPIIIKLIWFSSWRTVGRYFRLLKFSEKPNKMRYCSRPSNLNFFTHSSFICQDFVTSFQSVDSFQRTLIANMFICEKKLKYQIWKRDFRCKLSLMRCWPRLWASSGAFAFFSVHQRELLSNADVVQSQLLRRKQKEKRILVAAFATVWLYHHLACQVNLSG